MAPRGVTDCVESLIHDSEPSSRVSVFSAGVSLVDTEYPNASLVPGVEEPWTAMILLKKKLSFLPSTHNTRIIFFITHTSPRPAARGFFIFLPRFRVVAVVVVVAVAALVFAVFVTRVYGLAPSRLRAEATRAKRTRKANKRKNTRTAHGESTHTESTHEKNTRKAHKEGTRGKNTREARAETTRAKYTRKARTKKHTRKAQAEKRR